MKIKAKIETDATPITLHLKGRLAWTMPELVKECYSGITTLRNPALPVSQNVITLRRKRVAFNTDLQRYGGVNTSQHARYTLSSNVSLGAAL